MLGFRPISRPPSPSPSPQQSQAQAASSHSASQQQQQQQQQGGRRKKKPSATPSIYPYLRCNSTPLPVIYEDKNHDRSPRSLRDSSTSHSTSSSSPLDGISDYDSLSVVWPPQNSIPWPPPNYDEFAYEPEATHDDDAPHPARPLLHRPPSVVRYGSADDFTPRDVTPPRKRTWGTSLFSFLSPLSRRVEEKRWQWLESYDDEDDDDRTPRHSNRHLVVGNADDGWSDSSESGDSEDDSKGPCSEGSGGRRRDGSNHSLLHRQYDARHRHHAWMIRIWQTLSVGVMIVFCVCLVVMPSVLQNTEKERHSSAIKKKHVGEVKYGKEYVSTSSTTVMQDEQEEGEWKYPKPWKYLFGMENDEEGEEYDEHADQNLAMEVNKGDPAPSENNDTQHETSLPPPMTIDTIQVNTSSDSPSQEEDDSDTTSSLINTNITFASLASIMLPPYFETTMELCKFTITPYHPPSPPKHDKGAKTNKQFQTNKLDLTAPTTSVTPDSVFELRKNILKTRDLLDVFSPVYPPQYNGYTQRHHEGDLDFATRDVLWATGQDFDLTLESGEKKRHRRGTGWTLGGSQRETIAKHDMAGSSSRNRNRRDETKTKEKEEIHTDLWKILRNFLDGGYTIIGDFQDLDHAKIEYTPEQLAQYQLVVWEWHVDFMTFATRNYLDIMRYLSNPCPILDEEENDDEKRGKAKAGKTSKKPENASLPPLPSCQYSHSKSSHLFWGGTPKIELPDGNQVAASKALGRLGSEQLERAQNYLNMLWTKDHVISKADVNEPVEKVGASKHSSSGVKKSDNDSLTPHYDAPVEEEEDGVNVHEVYHNLRKELRSFLDEVDLFGNLLVPDTMVQPEVIVLGLVTDPSLGGEAMDTPNNDVVSTPSVAPDQHPMNLGVAGKEVIGPQISPPIDTNQPQTTTMTVTPSNISDAKQKTFDALTAIGQTRKLLGDLNDDYTAYMKYVEWNTNYGDQVRLMSKIEAEWNHFRWWAAQIDLNGQIDFLRSRMTLAPTPSPSPPQVDDGAVSDDSSPNQGEDAVVLENPGEGAQWYTEEPLRVMDEFLKERKSNPTSCIVIGNDAGDADSVVSAIALAFIESFYGQSQATPIVSISKESFLNERPEINLLFNLAGLQDAGDELLFIEDLVDMLDAARTLDFTLVDHNTFNSALDQFKEKSNIVEILDHHNDEGKYLDTCSGKNRNVAFSQGAALVASSCTLVAERLKGLCDDQLDPSSPFRRYPEPVATLLLGVILIDSVNLNESMGKVTQRDRDAVYDLILHTDWRPTASKTYIMSADSGVVTIDTDMLFDKLQRAKYEVSFWNAIPVERALLYDYKDFHSDGIELYNKVGDKRNFGIATILMPGADFIQKNGFALKTKEFMLSSHISFLGIMFAFYDSDSDDTLRRQLAFCADNSITLDGLLDAMLSSEVYNYVNLGLEKVDETSQTDEFQFYLYEQTNVKPSRKQIGPLLEIVYESYLLSS